MTAACDSRVIEPSKALEIGNVKPEDAGLYSCSENLLGSANASTTLNVQCFFISHLWRAR